MTDIDIYIKLLSLPENMKKEADDFINRLKSRIPGKGSATRKAGLAKGLIQMSEDFDEPLDDFNEYMK